MNFDFVMCVNKDNPFLETAISSIATQNYSKEYGIIVIANNCTDELFNKLVKLLSIYPNVLLNRTEIGQLAFNLNYAANLSKADYLIRMDADDVSMTDRLRVTEEKLIESNFPDVLVGGTKFINESDEVIPKKCASYNGKKLLKKLAYRNVLCHPASAIKRSSLLKVRGYIGGLNSEDYDLWLRMLRSGFTICTFSDHILNYRISRYQVKGSSIAYADSAGLLIREFLLTGHFNFLFGFIYSSLKFFYLKFTNKFSD
ncbi:MAG: glycosyltransferase [Plesiomonas shigelloides]